MDTLDAGDKHYARKFQGMQDRLDNLYDRISGFENEIADVEEKIKAAYGRQISEKQLYQILQKFDILYAEMSDIEKKEFMQLFIDAIELYPEKMDDGRIIRQIDLAFPVYYVVVNYLYVGCWYLINMVIESVCFGVSNNWNPGKSCILSPIYYLTNNLRIQSVENSEYVTVGIEFKGAYLLGIYAVAGVVFLIAAYQLYKWRKLETAGDLISMRGIKPVFRWGCLRRSAWRNCRC